MPDVDPPTRHEFDALQKWLDERLSSFRWQMLAVGALSSSVGAALGAGKDPKEVASIAGILGLLGYFSKILLALFAK